MLLLVLLCGSSFADGITEEEAVGRAVLFLSDCLGLSPEAFRQRYSPEANFLTAGDYAFGKPVETACWLIFSGGSLFDSVLFRADTGEIIDSIYEDPETGILIRNTVKPDRVIPPEAALPAAQAWMDAHYDAPRHGTLRPVVWMRENEHLSGAVAGTALPSGAFAWMVTLSDDLSSGADWPVDWSLTVYGWVW